MCHKEVKRAFNMLSEGFSVDSRVSKKGVPYLVVEGEVSLCYFASRKYWLIYDWRTNRTITQCKTAKLAIAVSESIEKIRCTCEVCGSRAVLKSTTKEINGIILKGYTVYRCTYCKTEIATEASSRRFNAAVERTKL